MEKRLYRPIWFRLSNEGLVAVLTLHPFGWAPGDCWVAVQNSGAKIVLVQAVHDSRRISPRVCQYSYGLLSAPGQAQALLRCRWCPVPLVEQGSWQAQCFQLWYQSPLKLQHALYVLFSTSSHFLGSILANTGR